MLVKSSLLRPVSHELATGKTRVRNEDVFHPIDFSATISEPLLQQAKARKIESVKNVKCLNILNKVIENIITVKVVSPK